MRWGTYAEMLSTAVAHDYNWQPLSAMEKIVTVQRFEAARYGIVISTTKEVRMPIDNSSLGCARRNGAASASAAE